MSLLAGSVRQLVRRPGFALFAAGVLALGLGAALAIIEVVDAVLLRPLPFPQEERLVNAWQSDLRGGGTRLTVTGADFLAWQSEAMGFDRMAAVSARGFNLLGGDRPERIEGAIVSAGFFSLLGVAPLVGRAFTPGLAGPRAALLSESLWRARFGGETSAVGRTISLDGEPVEVMGVMPASFRYPATAELWLSARTRVPEHPTYPIDPETDRGRHYLTVLGRLRPGISLAEAQSQLRVVQERIAREHPDEDGDVGAMLVPLREQIFGPVRPLLLALLGIAGLLLGVAWANVAHLFLARTATRSHEVAIRVALGATRASLWKLHFVEALVIASVAAAGGLAIAAFLAPALVAASPQANSLPSPRISAEVIAAAVVLALLCGATLGLIGALQRVRTAESLQEGGRTGAGSRRQSRFRAALIAFEIALSLLLLLAAGLLERSFRLLSAVDPGFQPQGALAADLPLPRLRYPDARTQARFAGDLLRKLREDPQVETAGLVSRLPLSPSNTVGELTLPGRESEAFPVDLRLATDGYAEALRIPLREGRTFTPGDLLPGAPPVAVVNEAAARRAFPGGKALGQRVLIWGEKVPSEIVGVVGNVRHVGLETDPRPEAWRPVGAVGWSNLSVAVRVRGSPAAAAGAVREAIGAIDHELPVVRLEPMQDRTLRTLAPREFTLELLASLALLAALLAAAGVHGVTTYLVAQRRRELGVRLALGATPGGIVRFVVGEMMTPVAAGCVFGIGAAAALSRFARGFLYGVAPMDPATFLLLPLLLAGIAALATASAAGRAARVDPAESLRSS
ncbi:MAG: FtsX-like permease family protein [Deltaproteobacteria bacterium]|nr:MAG: FtsX-like permease family protein [Deltaproteobacteria bacterium]